MYKKLDRYCCHNLISKHYSKLIEFTELSFNKMQLCKGLILDSDVEVKIEPKTFANIVHDVFEAYAKDYFNNVDGVHAGKFNGVFGVLFEGKCFVRFNKLNNDFSISNARTKQRDRFLNQIPIDFFENEITYLNFGYRVDSFWNLIKGIHLVFWNGCFEWEIDVKNEIINLEQKSIEFEPTLELSNLQEKRRTALKQVNDKEIDKNRKTS